jgi:hypothetical protein
VVQSDTGDELYYEKKNKCCPVYYTFIQFWYSLVQETSKNILSRDDEFCDYRHSESRVIVMGVNEITRTRVP